MGMLVTDKRHSSSSFLNILYNIYKLLIITNKKIDTKFTSPLHYKLQTQCNDKKLSKN